MAEYAMTALDQCRGSTRFLGVPALGWTADIIATTRNLKVGSADNYAGGDPRYFRESADVINIAVVARQTERRWPKSCVVMASHRRHRRIAIEVRSAPYVQSVGVMATTLN
jgi:hypothetical protein